MAHRSLFPGVPFAMGLGHSIVLEVCQSGNTTRNWLSALLQHGLTRAHVAGHEPDLERRRQSVAEMPPLNTPAIRMVLPSDPSESSPARRSPMPCTAVIQIS